MEDYGNFEALLGLDTQDAHVADYLQFATTANAVGRLEDSEQANVDFAAASRANSATPSSSGFFDGLPRWDDVGEAAGTPSLQVPQITIDPALQDPGQAAAVPQVSLAAQVPQVTAGSVLQVPGVAHMPQNQHFFGQVNDTNHGRAGQEAYAGNQYGSTAHGMPAPQPRNGMQLGMYSGMQAQQPQFTQGVPYVPVNPYLGIGTSTNQIMPGQVYGMFPMTGQLPQVNQFVPPNPSVQVNQPAQHAQPAQPAQTMLHPKRKRRGEANNDPAGRYNKPTGLRPWGPQVGNNKKEHLFQYYRSSAELRTNVTYTRDQLVDFFLGVGHPNPKRHLTLWIQNTPAQANDRYANGGSSAKCRFVDCPANQNTIQKGFWRVAFDEFSDISGKVHGVDPLQNAGYMHLHCFETAFDLGYLMHYGAARHRFRIAPDTREFDMETKNPMSITRDHREMLTAYNEWRDGQKARADRIEVENLRLPEHQRYTGFAPLDYDILPHNERLGHALTAKHLSLEVPGRARTRQKRGGVHIEMHTGDLDRLNELKRQRRQGSREPSPDEQQVQNERTASLPHNKGKKRSGSDDAEASNVKRQKATHSPSSQNVQAHLASQAADTIVVGGPLYQPQATAYTPSDNLYANLPPHLIQQIADRQDELEEGDIEEMIQAEERDRRRMRLAGVRRFPQRVPQPQPQPDLLNPGPVTRKRAREADDDDSQQQQQNQQDDDAAADQHLRKRARQAEADVLSRLSASPHLTRQAAFNIQTRLSQEPPPVQSQVRAALPQPYASLLQQLSPREEDGDRLARRIARLDASSRRAVLQAVGKEERRGDVLGEKKRKVQSL